MYNEITLFFLLFARLMGFFLLSPLFSGRSVPKTIRLGLALVTSLLLGPPLINQHALSFNPSFLLSLQLLKELILGYLVGYLFSLILEAAAFAGQFVGTMMGFSATELLDPLATSEHPLMARFFSLLIFTLFIALDLHHTLLRFLFESFEILPINTYPFNEQVILGMIGATTQLFHLALEFAIFPSLILLSLIALFALLSRYFSIYWVSFPLLLIAGFIAISLSLAFFPSILENAFSQFWVNTKKIFLVVSI